MRGPLLLLPLLLAGCSCQPDPPHPGRLDRPAPDALASASSADETASTDPVQAPGAADTAAVAAGAAPPSDVVRTYVTSLPTADRGVSSGFWLHPSAAGSAGDGALRALRDVRTLRVSTGQPVARDERHPSALIEVPVEIRVQTDQSRLHFRGWYRLVPDAEGAQWKLQAASVRPVLE